MSRYLVEFDDEKIKQVAGQIIETAVCHEIQKAEVNQNLFYELTKEIVYSHKEEIIERVVKRASKELVKKGLPKLLERLENE